MSDGIKRAHEDAAKKRDASRQEHEEGINNGEVTCRGSMRIGNACGVCSKCKKEIEELDALCQAYWQKHDSFGYSDAVPLPTALVGWICPKCGAGNSPSNTRCPCVPYKVEIT